MIEHQQRARPLVHEIKAKHFLSGAASRSVPLLMPHLNLTYGVLHPTASVPFVPRTLSSAGELGRYVLSRADTFSAT